MFTITNYSQTYREQYQYILLEFDDPMDTTGLFDKSNYVVYTEEGDTLQIFGAGYRRQDSSLVQTNAGIHYSGIVTEQFQHDIYHTVKVSWVKNMAGLLIAENNYAFTLLPLVDTTKTVGNVRVTDETTGELDTLVIDSVYASGQEDPNHGPEKAIDGFSYTTPGSDININCWTSCCLADPGGQWFVAAFNDEHFIENLYISPTYYYTGRSYGLEIQISDNAVNWETILTFDTLPNVEWNEVIIGRNTQYIRINFLTNSTPTSDWAGLWEIVVIGD